MPDQTQYSSSLINVPPPRPTYLAVGVFDGVHRGHQALLAEMVAAARQNGARSGVLTFFPHPVVVIKGVTGRLYLQPLDERAAAIKKLGIDLVIAHPFDELVRQLPADEFIGRLQRYLDMRQLWGGHFSLGYQRQGDFNYLSQLGANRGFTVHKPSRMNRFAGERISSSHIRQALRTGDLATANSCLGRPYEVAGTVVKGKQLGRAIGFPTANLAIWAEQVLPANGVYAASAQMGAASYQAAVNIGVRPTVNGSQLTVEAHLLDFDADIYGQELKLALIDRIRDERKFDGLPPLIAQIKMDVAQIRALLAGAMS